MSSYPLSFLFLCPAVLKGPHLSLSLQPRSIGQASVAVGSRRAYICMPPYLYPVVSWCCSCVRSLLFLSSSLCLRLGRYLVYIHVYVSSMETPLYIFLCLVLHTLFSCRLSRPQLLGVPPHTQHHPSLQDKEASFFFFSVLSSQKLASSSSSGQRLKPPGFSCFSFFRVPSLQYQEQLKETILAGSEGSGPHHPHPHLHAGQAMHRPNPLDTAGLPYPDPVCVTVEILNAFADIQPQLLRQTFFTEAKTDPKQESRLLLLLAENLEKSDNDSVQVQIKEILIKVVCSPVMELPEKDEVHILFYDKGVIDRLLHTLFLPLNADELPPGTRAASPRVKCSLVLFPHSECSQHSVFVILTKIAASPALGSSSASGLSLSQAWPCHQRK